jgi:hypothetical protein
MSSPDHTRNVINLVAAAVDAPAGVINTSSSVKISSMDASARGIVFTEDVMKIAGPQGRYAVGHGYLRSAQVFIGWNDSAGVVSRRTFRQFTLWSVAQRHLSCDVNRKAIQFAKAGDVFQADFHRPDDRSFLQRQSVACLIVGDAAPNVSHQRRIVS